MEPECSQSSLAICEGEVLAIYHYWLAIWLPELGCLLTRGKQWEMTLFDYPWTFRPKATFTLNDRSKIRNMFWHLLECIA